MTEAGGARHVAVIDIGKTNAKLALHDLRDGTDRFVRTVPNEVRRDGPYPHHDTEALWRFLLDALADCAAVHPIDAISVTTHGASAVLVDEDGLALPHLDYEHDGPEAVRAAYDRARPPFRETFSPRLPNGLNVGAQVFWLSQAFPEAFARARHLLFVPQYWSWRLTGIAASEATSLGCHTDLWQPAKAAFSSLVAERGWQHLFPPVRSAFDVVGPLKAPIAERIGLGKRAIPVRCGIHDSNASLLPHLLARPAPFSVLSTGTWIIAFAVGGGDLDRLDPERDTLANVDAFARAVPSARFMGGREFDVLTGGDAREPDEAAVAALLSGDAMALPSFAPGTGPFPRQAGRWTVDPDGLPPGERTAAASLYCALLAITTLDLIGAAGPIVVEGPFARNTLFCRALAALAGRRVTASAGATGTTAGAALLAVGRDRIPPAPNGTTFEPEPISGLTAYAERWNALVGR